MAFYFKIIQLENQAHNKTPVLACLPEIHRLQTLIMLLGSWGGRPTWSFAFHTGIPKTASEHHHKLPHGRTHVPYNQLGMLDYVSRPQIIKPSANRRIPKTNKGPPPNPIIREHLSPEANQLLVLCPLVQFAATFYHHLSKVALI